MQKLRQHWKRALLLFLAVLAVVALSVGGTIAAIRSTSPSHSAVATASPTVGSMPTSVPSFPLSPTATNTAVTSTPVDQRFCISLSGAEWDFASKDYEIAGEQKLISELTYYAAHDVHCVRLPLRGSRLLPNGSFDPNEEAWLVKFVHTAASLHIGVIPDLHNWRCMNDLSGDTTCAAPSTRKILVFWQKVAGLLVHEPNVYGYDILSEPDPASLGGSWISTANDIIKAIRIVDGVHYIFIEEGEGNHSQSWSPDEAAAFSDSKNLLIYSPHDYWDYNQSGVYAYIPANAPPKDKKAAHDLAINSLKDFVAWCKDTKSRCWVGEYGVPTSVGYLLKAPHFSNQTNWLWVLGEALTYLRDNRIGGSYWAGGLWQGDALSCDFRYGKDSEQLKLMEPFFEAQAAA